MKLSGITAMVGLLPQIAFAAPTAKKLQVWKRGTNTPSIELDFPDPSIMKAGDGIWYAFATAGNGKQVQAATTSDPTGQWSWVNTDCLPNPGNWTTGENTWAPDVRLLDDGTYVMYYSGQVAADSNHHCIGTATSSTPLGPYTASPEPFVCDLCTGGSIDPSGFNDTDGTRYVVYKIDGNSIGHGGSCNNEVAPLIATPLLLQKVAADGITKVGSAVQLLDRIEADGPLIEAPAIMSNNGKYTLFFSSGCYTESTYNINYAQATSIQGPYTRSSTPLVRTDDAFGLTAPGGATPFMDGSGIVFHAYCDVGRCFYQTEISDMGTQIALNGAK